MPDHPDLSPLSNPPSLEGLDEEERIDAMVDWFNENFEDPAQETPYNGREGGYLYIHGGPYEARNYIIDAFPDATEEEHVEAIDRIDAEGPNYAPAGHRVLAPEEDYEDVEPSDPRPPLDYRLDQLSLQIGTIGKHVEEIIAIQRREETGEAGIGHNQPPEPIEGEPDLNDVLESIRELRVELAKPDRANTADVAVIEKAQGRFAGLRAWLDALKAKAASSMIEGAAKAAGTLLFGYAVEHHAEIYTAVTGAITTMADWLHLLAPMF